MQHIVQPRHASCMTLDSSECVHFKLPQNIAHDSKIYPHLDLCQY